MSVNLKRSSLLALDSGRISPSKALDLLLHAQLAELMNEADKIRCRMHGRTVHCVHSLNLNPTNICENHCDLCAFWRDRDMEDAYVLSIDEAKKQMESGKSWGLTDLHVVGGLTKNLNLDYYIEFFSMARKILPSLPRSSSVLLRQRLSNERHSHESGDCLAEADSIRPNTMNYATTSTPVSVTRRRKCSSSGMAAETAPNNDVFPVPVPPEIRIFFRRRTHSSRNSLASSSMILA